MCVCVCVSSVQYTHINTKHSFYWKTSREADEITTSRFTIIVIQETASSPRISSPGFVEGSMRKLPSPLSPSWHPPPLFHISSDPVIQRLHPCCPYLLSRQMSWHSRQTSKPAKDPFPCLPTTLSLGLQAAPCTHLSGRHFDTTPIPTLFSPERRSRQI